MRRADYPADWEQVRERVLWRAHHKCERCGAANHRPHPVKGYRVVLTIAHLNGPGGPCFCRPLCSDPEHLAAWCQGCHLSYDRPKHLRRAALTRRARKGVMELFPELVIA